MQHRRKEGVEVLQTAGNVQSLAHQRCSIVARMGLEDVCERPTRCQLRDDVRVNLLRILRRV